MLKVSCSALVQNVSKRLFYFGYQPLRLLALLKPLKKMYKPRAYKRHITVRNFYPKIISAFTSFCFCADQTQDGLLLKKKKPIFCTSTIGFHWKMQVREAGLVRLSFVSTTGKPCEIRSAVRVFYCDLFEIQYTARVPARPNL